MKLPGINYATPVQSLGRQDPGDPVAVAQAQGRAMSQFVKLAVDVSKDIAKSETASSAAVFQTQMAEVNAAVKAKKSYTTEELDELEIKYDTKKYGMDEGQSQEVPSYLVSSKVYRKLTKALYDEHSAKANTKGKKAISKMYGSMYEKGVTGVITSSINTAYALRSVEMEKDFDSAVATGNLDAAVILSETARDIGIWSPEKFLAKTRDMPNKIATGQYMVDLNKINEPVIMESMMSILLNDPALSPESKSSLYAKYDSKAKTMRKEQAVAAKEMYKQNSYDVFIDTSTTMLDNNEPLSWDEVNRIAGGMERSDGNALLTLNRMMGEKGMITDPRVHMELSVLVNAISLPREGTNIYQRREAAVNRLMAAAGFDPFTGDRFGPSKISPEDFSSLWSKINKSQSFTYDNPEVTRMVDFMWSTLTGGSKDMMSRFFGTGPDTINATQAEASMLEMARQQGPSFNPDQWWKTNGVKYITTAIEDNERTIKENRLDKYIKKDPNFPGGIDMDTTVKGINNLIKSGAMDSKTGREAIKDIYSIQQLRSQREELIKGTK